MILYGIMEFCVKEYLKFVLDRAEFLPEDLN